jgi:TPR repeat protein
MRREDIEKGVGYLINAAAKGNVAAQQWLAFYVQTDKSGKVFHYLNQFAAQGHAEAQHALDYFQRRRNATDEERATSSFERTAEHGADFAE